MNKILVYLIAHLFCVNYITCADKPSNFSVTTAVLRAFFASPERKTAENKDITVSTPDNVTITQQTAQQSDACIPLAVRCPIENAKQSPDQLNSKIQAAYMAALQKNMSFGQWIQYQLGMGVDRATLEKKYWVDDAMQMQG